MTTHDGSQRKWVPESELVEGWTVLDDADARLAWSDAHPEAACLVDSAGIDAMMVVQEVDYDPDYPPSTTVSGRHAIAVTILLVATCWALIAVVVLAVAHAL